MSALAFSRAVSILVCSLGFAAALVGDAASQGTASRPLVSEAQFEAWQTELSNWGRWGKDDELGTLNLITPEKRRAALALVKEGVPASLSTNTAFEKAIDVPCPAEWAMTSARMDGATDRVAFPCIHGAASTHIDSLAHTFFAGKMWNGYDAALVTSTGAAKNSIDKTKDKLAGRGVLLDVARFKGVRSLEPGYAITVADLEATAAAQKVEVRRGDFLLIRTGHMTRYLDRGDWRGFDLDDFPGVSIHTAPWMHARQIAAVASDNYAVEVRPSELLPAFRNPFHVVAIPNMGLTLGEIFSLDELAADCASDGRWEFLFVAPPLPVTRAVGTPINPYAMK